MKKLDTILPGVSILEPKVFEDPRGFFMETWQEARYDRLGIGDRFIQDNLSQSSRGVLRGMHFQMPNPQGKLLSVIVGCIYDVVVDLRVGSPQFGKWVGIELSDSNRHQVFVPPGLAHGFFVMSEKAIVSYKVTDVYNSLAEFSLLWDDPDVGIKWPVGNPILSKKDAAGFRFRDIPHELLVRL